MRIQIRRTAAGEFDMKRSATVGDGRDHRFAQVLLDVGGTHAAGQGAQSGLALLSPLLDAQSCCTGVAGVIVELDDCGGAVD